MTKSRARSKEREAKLRQRRAGGSAFRGSGSATGSANGKAGEGVAADSESRATGARNDSESKAASGKASSGKASKGSIASLLLSNNSELLFQILSYSPLAVGAWLSGGVELPHPYIFTSILAVVVLQHYHELILRERIAIMVERRWLMFGAVAATIVFALLSRHIAASILMAAYTVLSFGEQLLPRSTFRGLLLIIVTVIFRLAVLGILAVFSQSLEISLVASLIGLTPAFYLVASILALESRTFEAAGWRRNRSPGESRFKWFEPKRSKHSEQNPILPGILAQLFSLSLVIAPTVCMGLSVVGYLPPTFLLLGIPVYFMPKLAGGFLEQLLPDSFIAERSIRIGVFAELLLLIAGTLAYLI